jgi:small subunit ribosomal protein S20
MANHKSAEKRNRQNPKRRARNRWHRGQLRAALKDFRDAVETGSSDAADKLATATRSVAKKASRGVLHKKTASRLISRMTKALAKAKA